MSTKITADNGVELEVCHLGIDATNPNPTEPSSIWARLTAEQRTKLAAALAPERTPIPEGGPVHGINVTGYVGDAPIKPVDCDRTTVYTGECRNFADTEWIRFDSGRRRSPDARDGNTWLIDVAYGSFWMADDKVRNIVPLVPAPAGGQWTRDDLPEFVFVSDATGKGGDRLSPGIRDGLVDHLNTHHTKSGMEARLDAEAAGAEMTAAYAARDAAERRCDELRSLIAGQSANVDVYREKVREAERQRDEADRRTAEAEADRDRWKLHHDRVDGQWAKAEREVTTLRSTGAVSRADIEKVVEAVFDREAGYGLGSDKPWPGTQPVASAVWDYLKGDDPAVYVVRASHIHALTDPEDARHFYLADGQWEFRDPTESDLDHAWDEVESDLRYLIAVRQAREAEKAVDPVEDAAVDAFKAAWHRADEEGDEGNRVRRGIRAARHVLGREADQ